MANSRTTTIGYVIDPSHAYLFIRIADDLERYMPELTAIAHKHITRARPDELKTRTNTQPLPLDPQALTEADEIRDTVYAWLFALAQTEGRRIDWYQASWTAVAEYVRDRVQRLLRWEESPAMLDELTDACRRAERLIDGPQPHPLVGPCPACNRAVYAPAHVPEPKCRHCGETLDRAERLETMRARASQLWLPRAKALHLAATITGQRIKPDTLTKWAQRHIVRTRPGPTYCIADILQRIQNPPANLHKSNTRTPKVDKT